MMTDEEWTSKINETLSGEGYSPYEMDRICYICAQISFFLMINKFIFGENRKYIARALEAVAFMIRLHEAEEKKEAGINVDTNGKAPN